MPWRAGQRATPPAQTGASRKLRDMQLLHAVTAAAAAENMPGCQTSSFTADLLLQVLMPPACTEAPRSSLHRGRVLPRRSLPLLCLHPRRLRCSPTPRRSCPGCPLPAPCGGVHGRLRCLHSLAALQRRLLLTWRCEPSLVWWTPSAAAPWWQVSLLSQLLLVLLAPADVCRNHPVAACQPGRPADLDVSCSCEGLLQQSCGGRSACAGCFPWYRPLFTTSDRVWPQRKVLQRARLGASPCIRRPVHSDCTLLFLQLGASRGLS